MTDEKLAKYVNNFGLRCPLCTGDLKVDIFKGTVNVLHYLNIPGERVKSNESRCQFVSTDVKNAVQECLEDRKTEDELKNDLIAISRKSYA